MTTEETMKSIENFTADTQKTVSENVEKATKSLEEVAAFNQETLDAVMAAQKIAAKAAEEINSEVVAFSKKTVEEGVAHAKDLASAQTVTELLEKQTGFAKIAYESSVKEATKLNEMVVASVKDAFAPVTARMTAAADLMKAYSA